MVSICAPIQGALTIEESYSQICLLSYLLAWLTPQTSLTGDRVVVVVRLVVVVVGREVVTGELWQRDIFHFCPLAQRSRIFFAYLLLCPNNFK